MNRPSILLGGLSTRAPSSTMDRFIEATNPKHVIATKYQYCARITLLTLGYSIPLLILWIYTMHSLIYMANTVNYLVLPFLDLEVRFSGLMFVYIWWCGLFFSGNGKDVHTLYCIPSQWVYLNPKYGHETLISCLAIFSLRMLCTMTYTCLPTMGL